MNFAKFADRIAVGLLIGLAAAALVAVLIAP